MYTRAFKSEIWISLYPLVGSSYNFVPCVFNLCRWWFDIKFTKFAIESNGEILKFDVKQSLPMLNILSHKKFKILKLNL